MSKKNSPTSSSTKVFIPKQVDENERLRLTNANLKILATQSDLIALDARLQLINLNHNNAKNEYAQVFLSLMQKYNLKEGDGVDFNTGEIVTKEERETRLKKSQEKQPNG